MGRYLVILHGAVPPTDQALSGLAERLVQELGCSPESVQQVLENLPSIIHNGLTQESAEDYLKILQAFGADVEILEATSSGIFPTSLLQTPANILKTSAQAEPPAETPAAAQELPAMEPFDDLLAMLDHELADGEPAAELPAESDTAAPAEESDPALLDLSFGSMEADPEPAASPESSLLYDSQVTNLESELEQSLSFGDTPVEEVAAPTVVETPEPEKLFDFGFGNADPAEILAAAAPEVAAAPVEDFSDLEAELNEALSFGDSEPVAAPAVKEAPKAAEPEEELLNFSLDEEPAAKPAAADAKAGVAPTPNSAASPAAPSELEAEMSFSIDDDEPAVAAPPAMPYTEASGTASAQKYLQDEAALFAVEPDTGSDEDPLAARLNSDHPPTAPAEMPSVEKLFGPAPTQYNPFQARPAPAATDGPEAAPAANSDTQNLAANAADQNMLSAGISGMSRRRQIMIVGAGAACAVVIAFGIFLLRPKHQGMALTEGSIESLLKQQESILNSRAENQKRLAEQAAVSEKWWTGSTFIDGISVRVELHTRNDVLREWRLEIEGSEPLPLTEEEFGTGIDRPWIRKIEAQGKIKPPKAKKRKKKKGQAEAEPTPEATQEPAAAANQIMKFSGPGRAYITDKLGAVRLSVTVNCEFQIDGNGYLFGNWHVESVNPPVLKQAQLVNAIRLHDSSFVFAARGDMDLESAEVDPNKPMVKPEKSKAKDSEGEEEEEEEEEEVDVTPAAAPPAEG